MLIQPTSNVIGQSFHRLVEGERSRTQSGLGLVGPAVSAGRPALCRKIRQMYLAATRHVVEAVPSNPNRINHFQVPGPGRVLAQQLPFAFASCST